MHREIPLSQGYVALVDTSDFEFLNQWKWFASKDGDQVYAKRSVTMPGQANRTVWMHRQITGCPDGWSVDHANRNGLDNRKVNLRLCTHGQNCVNVIKPRRVAPYRGIRKTGSGSWQVRLRVDGKNKSFETFVSPEDAARRYDQLAREIHGPFAVVNFPS